MPPEIEALFASLTRLPGVHSPETYLTNIWGVTPDILDTPPHALLPHAALRFAGGEHAHQVIAQFEFQLERNEDGWRSLEFIAWCIRDCSRGGLDVQLRPFGLPPEAGATVQLGETLRFHIDLFGTSDGDSLAPVLAKVSELASDLTSGANMYARSVRPSQI